MAIARNTLRVLSLERLGAVFHEITTPLSLTPRKFNLDKRVSMLNEDVIVDIFCFIEFGLYCMYNDIVDSHAHSYHTDGLGVSY